MARQCLLRTVDNCSKKPMIQTYVVLCVIQDLDGIALQQRIKGECRFTVVVKQSQDVSKIDDYRYEHGESG